MDFPEWLRDCWIILVGQWQTVDLIRERLQSSNVVFASNEKAQGKSQPQTSHWLKQNRMTQHGEKKDRSFFFPTLFWIPVSPPLYLLSTLPSPTDRHIYGFSIHTPNSVKTSRWSNTKLNIEVIDSKEIGLWKNYSCKYSHGLERQNDNTFYVSFQWHCYTLVHSATTLPHITLI